MVAITRSATDYKNPKTREELLPNMEQHFPGSLATVMAQEGNVGTNAADLKNQAVILSVMKGLTGNRAGVEVNRERLRHWTYVFRIGVLEEDLDSALADKGRDDLDVDQDDD